VPLLQVAPSKQDAERLLLVSPELAHVLARIVHRVRGGRPDVPLVARYDQHERVTGAPLPHLFQRLHGTELRVICPAVVKRLLGLAIERAGLCGPDGQPLRYTPHDFRRIFATEAVSGGLPVHIAAKVLGHQDLNTTQAYAAVYQDDVLRHYRAFITRRRAQRPTEEYREPTAAEWAEFERHFTRRKVELGTCARPYGTPAGTSTPASAARCCTPTRCRSRGCWRSSPISRTASAKQASGAGSARSMGSRPASPAPARSSSRCAGSWPSHPSCPSAPRRSGGRDDRRGSECPRAVVAGRHHGVLPGGGCTRPSS
jgi:hypothetical protein